MRRNKLAVRLAKLENTVFLVNSNVIFAHKDSTVQILLLFLSSVKWVPSHHLVLQHAINVLMVISVNSEKLSLNHYILCAQQGFIAIMIKLMMGNWLFRLVPLENINLTECKPQYHLV